MIHYFKRETEFFETFGKIQISVAPNTINSLTLL